MAGNSPSFIWPIMVPMSRWRSCVAASHSLNCNFQLKKRSSHSCYGFAECVWDFMKEKQVQMCGCSASYHKHTRCKNMWIKLRLFLISSLYPQICHGCLPRCPLSPQLCSGELTCTQLPGGRGWLKSSPCGEDSSCPGSWSQPTSCRASSAWLLWTPCPHLYIFKRFIVEWWTFGRMAFSQQSGG